MTRVIIWSLARLEVALSGPTIQSSQCGLTAWKVWKFTIEKSHVTVSRTRMTDQISVASIMAPAQVLRLMLQCMAHPWSSDIFPTSAITDGAAARRCEKRKEDKYQHERLPADDVMSFVPLVFEHFSRWGEKAEGFLKELAKESTDEEVILTLVSLLATGESVYHCRSRSATQEWPSESFRHWLNWRIMTFQVLVTCLFKCIYISLGGILLL